MNSTPFTLWLRNCMRVKGMTSYDLAAHMGVTDGTVRTWTSGQRVPGSAAQRLLKLVMANPCYKGSRKPKPPIAVDPA